MLAVFAGGTLVDTGPAIPAAPKPRVEECICTDA
ncbi:predicted protein [Sclerotinia sclerotiorum 1980 UF-70]|uniref:Uncharacterized protein n=1 Tax=Sclerotinia sclerotiorum (strain ATCC 18683 / 1980 / Ss-1) TaxID=665079 RepID=A7EDX6_SCLS1|nr:predicted protein [Sclerotinia sclerotiorum 1980 UF-70]EDO01042.1 predicted protein [Sclerotinia sclerotiorum 1980 UF-70]